MKTVFLLSLCLYTVAALPRQQQRIVGGATTTINTYPFAASLQVTSNSITFGHTCGGTIINNRSIMSAAHCWNRNPVANRHRIRCGSSNRSSGGHTINVAQLFGHPSYNTRTHDNDVGVIRTSAAIPIGSASVRAGTLPAANLNIPDNSYVIAIGWGRTSTNGAASEQLRHVQLRTVNQARCNTDFRGSITANMICAGWTAAGRGVCFGDSGTGLIRNNAVVGISSFIHFDGCGSRWPDVFARVSRYITWIRNHA